VPTVRDILGGLTNHEIAFPGRASGESSQQGVIVGRYNVAVSSILARALFVEKAVKPDGARFCTLQDKLLDVGRQGPTKAGKIKVPQVSGRPGKTVTLGVTLGPDKAGKLHPTPGIAGINKIGLLIKGFVSALKEHMIRVPESYLFHVVTPLPDSVLARVNKGVFFALGAI